MATYIKAVPGAHNSVLYTDDTGRYFRFSGGTRSWRNNNPGNLHLGDVSKRNSAIRIAAKFVIFPDKDIGEIALIDSLTSTHVNESIDQLVHSYAPPKDHNNVKRYREFLHKATGIEDDKKVKDFT